MPDPSRPPPEPDSRPEVLFEERQRFREPWVVTLIFVLAAGAWVALVLAVVMEDSELQVWPAALMAVIFGLGFPWFLYSLELRTVVDRTGVRVHFRHGMGGHGFAVGDLVSATSIAYRPLRDFGGWGLRWGWGGSRAFNVSGDSGVEIVDVDGRRWVIGSQRPDELAAAVNALGVPPAPERSQPRG